MIWLRRLWHFGKISLNFLYSYICFHWLFSFTGCFLSPVVKEWIVFAGMLSSQRIVDDLVDVIMEGVIPCLVQELGAFPQAEYRRC